MTRPTSNDRSLVVSTCIIFVFCILVSWTVGCGSNTPEGDGGGSPGGEQGEPDDPVAPPEVEPPFELSHFLCYEGTTDSEAPYDRVHVDDQFTAGLRPTNLLHGGERVCNPVRKVHDERPTEIPRGAEDHHLLAIKAGVLEEKPQPKRVRVTNQFFPAGQDLERQIDVPSGYTGEHQRLMVPAHKLAMEPPGPNPQEHGSPVGLNHFLCHKVKDKPGPGVTVKLRDQTGEYKEVDVGPAVLLCNPTVKEHEGAQPPRYPIEPVRGRNDHLVCYDLEHSALARAYKLAHQLDNTGHRNFSTGNLDWLCVPSQKSELGGG